jgi:SAM-dependent methyltransferase
MAIKTTIRTAMDRLGLARLYFRLIEWKLSRRDHAKPPASIDGTPLPPAYLMTLVAGSPDWKWFLESGRRSMDGLAEYATAAGLPFSQATRILDLGCGCGRLARHLPGMTNAEIHGVDLNRSLVSWCARNLKGNFSRNRMHPPLNFPDQHFDIVYLLSVFTHLRPETQRAWLNELHRVTRPGGLVMVSFHDEDHNSLPPGEAASMSLAETGWYVFNNHVQGSNFMATYQTREATRAMFGSRFDDVRIVPSTEAPMTQAVAIAKRPA